MRVQRRRRAQGDSGQERGGIHGSFEERTGPQTDQPDQAGTGAQLLRLLLRDQKRARQGLRVGQEGFRRRHQLA